MSGMLASAEDASNRNLNGQKLGRKGKDTRARILAAATELLAEGTEAPLTLSAVARRASLGMTSIYLYFNDLTELVLAILEPVHQAAEQSYISLLRPHWPDEELAERCHAYVSAHHAFWTRHSRLLHLRNRMADAHDVRMMNERVAVAMPVIRLIGAQMGETEPNAPLSHTYGIASLLVTSLERATTVWTDTALHGILTEHSFKDTSRLLLPAARLLELGIREGRAAQRQVAEI